MYTDFFYEIKSTYTHVLLAIFELSYANSRNLMYRYKCIVFVVYLDDPHATLFQVTW
jgi:hypothetical protein